MQKMAQPASNLERLLSEKQAPLKQNSGDGRKRWLTLNES